MIYIQRSETPPVLDLEDSNSVGSKEYTEAIKHFEDKDRNFTFRAYKEVKDVLEVMFNSKCAYCESDISPVSYGDIEHFRPKSAYHTTKAETLKYPGYYWLAMDWNNLLLSCEVCNRTYKKNQFPLVDEAKRKKKYDEEVIEEPLLIDPCDASSNPQDHINFTEEGLVEYTLGGRCKGKKSIEVYGLDNPKLTRKRKKLAKEISDKKSQVLRYMDNIRALLATPLPGELKSVLENNFIDLETVYKSIKNLNLPTEPYQGLVRNLTAEFLAKYSPIIDKLLFEFHEQKKEE
ncbi:hypothetical protein B14911_16860 [Bacillus sp. NRRL B-14911]|uniref:Uncharacterized protein n=1 Tax=Bacillus infantis NRRL B-14911 TaxID=1367477 RepID=U5L5V4_9BACI|nr:MULTISPECIES: HNH endonuclease [Bacillus]AGX02775.1 hypothetical protein N288_04085 [Bacillus infantis NRRL B-14911]EAR67203.1 hypothetical protein B14911_16860 [Bacillus sp. NRRL B-14911]